jgi:hypothetical protein
MSALGRKRTLPAGRKADLRLAALLWRSVCYSCSMTRSDKSIIAIALVPNGAFVLGLLGWTAWRLTSGHSPFPSGATSIVMGLCMAVPFSTVMFANSLRLRRERSVQG